mmetsp:Transcript_108984/g.232909  ORF Transcript_108984/g.232909 Transcript_108984/m.232909 type:complete len:221 (+) Transcript_108984:812-1474(+)
MRSMCWCWSIFESGDIRSVCSALSTFDSGDIRSACRGLLIFESAGIGPNPTSGSTSSSPSDTTTPSTSSGSSYFCEALHLWKDGTEVHRWRWFTFWRSGDMPRSRSSLLIISSMSGMLCSTTESCCSGLGSGEADTCDAMDRRQFCIIGATGAPKRRCAPVSYLGPSSWSFFRRLSQRWLRVPENLVKARLNRRSGVSSSKSRCAYRPSYENRVRRNREA